VATDPSGGVKLILLPTTAVVANDLAIALYLTPIPGQLSYPPNGASGCALLRYTGSAWAVVDKSQLCDLQFSTLSLATTPGVCDGLIQGTFTGVFSANQTLGATFTLPTSVATSQIKQPSCRPYNSSCSKHTDCCSGSCSLFIGVCN